MVTEEKKKVSETKKDIVATDTGEVVGSEQGGNVFLTPRTETQKRRGDVAQRTGELANPTKIKPDINLTESFIGDLGLNPNAQAPQEQVQPEVIPQVQQQGAGLGFFDSLDLQKQLEASGSDAQVSAQPVAIGGGAGIIGSARVGGAIKTGGKAIIQTATALKNSRAVAKVVSTIKALGGNGMSVLGYLFVAEKVVDSTLNAKTDAQQQSLNTIGQVTSSIVGDSMSGAGDWRKGLKELDFIEQQMLEIERDIKAGTIKHKRLEFNGQLIDIGADVEDQLATISEGKRDIRSFAISGVFPELSEFEIQEQLRELERQGLIQPVDLTTSRRELS